VALNLIAAILSTFLALWMTIADFAYPGKLLFQDSISMLLLGLYLSLLFLLVLILAVFPKRIVIVANFLILSRAAMGWPLSLVMDYSLACRIISLSLLALSLYHLAGSLHRPLLQVHLRPWVRARHTIIAILLWIGIGIVSLPAVLLGYVEAGQSLLGHYVQISWGGVSLVERVFEKDGQRVHLIGMMHIGDGSFYTKLNERMRTPLPQGQRIVLTEGVADAQGILPAGFKSGETYAKLAGALGLEPQNAPVPADRTPGNVPLPTPEPVKIPGVTFRNADIDISALDEKHREILVAILEMLDTDNIAELLVAQPENVTGRDIELLLVDGLLRQRNDTLMGHFASSAPGYTEVFIPWGAAHLPDIEQRLLALGYSQQTETIRPIIQFWNESAP
jgi:hypothetical protein